MRREGPVLTVSAWNARRHVRPSITFALVGVVNTVVAYACYLVMHLVLPYLVAFLLSWVVGVLTSFLLNCTFTWHVPPTWRRLAGYPLSVAPNIVLSTIGVIVMVEVWGWSERLAPVVATVVALPLSYLLAQSILLRE